MWLINTNVNRLKQQRNAVANVTFLPFVFFDPILQSIWCFPGLVMNTKPVWMSVCVLALVFFVCIWSWHEGAWRFGQRGAGWCQLASGDAVQSHQIAVTGRFWLLSDAHAQPLVSPSHPLLSFMTPVSLSASMCLDVSLCTDNAFKLILELLDQLLLV